jgi:hypothetical protein
MWETLVNKLRAMRKRPAGKHIDQLLDRPSTSRFASTEEDLDTILQLRRAFFKKSVIVPDDIYVACWRRNPDTMKIVYDLLGKPIGYWSVIPIGPQSFEQFVKGKSTHEQMMSVNCLPWPEVDPDNAYLYVVGAVVPVPSGRNEFTLLHKMVSGQVILDMYSFGLEVIDRLDIKGICGYPSKTAGLTNFQKAGFIQTNIFIDNDKNQPVYVITADGLPKLREDWKSQKRRYIGYLPVWDSQDRKRVLRQIKRKHHPKVIPDLDDRLDNIDLPNIHANIRLLINRMDDALNRDDYASVLHASASIFETMAKDVVGIPTVQNQTLKSFFDRYRIDSNLPKEILDYILGIYDLRNTTPLAGHGSTQAPAINQESAISLSEMTRAFIRIEYRLRQKRADSVDGITDQ